MFSMTERSGYRPNRWLMYPISPWILPVSARIECPITQPSPSDGSNIPVRRRITVVFPAPSGPTSPKISPSSTEQVSRSTATVEPKALPSPSVRIASNAHLASLSRPDGRVRRHSRFQFHVRVGDIDLDAVNELDALFPRLDVFRRKFGLRGDKRNASGVLLSGIGVGGHL